MTERRDEPERSDDRDDGNRGDDGNRKGSTDRRDRGDRGGRDEPHRPQLVERDPRAEAKARGKKEAEKVDLVKTRAGAAL